MKTLPNEAGDQVLMKRRGLMYFQILAPWIIALGLWGLVFSHLIVGIGVGFTVGIAGCLMTAMAMKNAKTAEKAADMSFAAGAVWVVPATFIGVIGVVALVVKVIF